MSRNYAIVALSVLILLPPLLYLIRRVTHYRKVRTLADAIANAVLLKGSNDVAAFGVIQDRAAVVFGVPRGVVQVSRENGNWIVILFTRPVDTPWHRLFHLSEQARAFLPTWANFKLLTTDEEPRNSVETAAERRRAKMAAVVATLSDGEKASQGTES
mgnify:FL=1